MRNRASDRRIPRSDALTLNHRDFTVSEVYYEVYMTRVLYTARIRNFDSVMFLNRVRELVSIELGKEMLSIFCSPRKSSSCECHSDGYAGYFLELPGRYQSSRELKIQFHAGGVIWSLGRRQERTARVTWIPQISFFQFMKSAKKGSQSFPPLCSEMIAHEVHLFLIYPSSPQRLKIFVIPRIYDHRIKKIKSSWLTCPVN